MDRPDVGYRKDVFTFTFVLVCGVTQSPFLFCLVWYLTTGVGENVEKST
jgi:hypothetical protein